MTLTPEQIEEAIKFEKAKIAGLERNIADWSRLSKYDDAPRIRYESYIADAKATIGIHQTIIAALESLPGQAGQENEIDKLLRWALDEQKHWEEKNSNRYWQTSRFIAQLDQSKAVLAAAAKGK